MKIKTYAEALKFINNTVPKSSSQKFPGEIGLKRTFAALDILDSPQEKLKIIHVAGTSGKGSTCYLTSLGLSSLGFKVGLHLSPHLISLRERFQIFNRRTSGELISKNRFVRYLNEILPAFKEVEQLGYGKLSYFELLVVLAFHVFYKEKVEYAVFEVGMGGLYDATNTIKNGKKVSIITKIGLDHTNILGKNKVEIAAQKAGIIRKGNKLVYIRQEKDVNNIFEKQAKTKQAKTYPVRKGINFTDVRINRQGSKFKFFYPPLIDKKLDVNLGLLGKFQAENASLALTAISILAQQYKFRLEKDKILSAFKKANFPGRFQKISTRGKTIIFDGAHNSQKMQAFIDSLNTIFPGKKFTFLLAFKRGKDYKKMLKIITPLAKQVFLTSFFVHQDTLSYLSVDPKEVENKIKNLNLDISVHKDSIQAFTNFIDCLERDEIGIVTGSLYLIGEIERKISRKERVV